MLKFMSKKPFELINIVVEDENRGNKLQATLISPQAPVELCIRRISTFYKKTVFLKGLSFIRHIGTRDISQIPRAKTWHPLAKFTKVRGPAYRTSRICIRNRSSDGQIRGLMGLENLIGPVLIGPTVRIDKSNDFSPGHRDTKITGIAAEFSFRELIEPDIRERFFDQIGHAIHGAVNHDDLERLICVLVF